MSSIQSILEGTTTSAAIGEIAKSDPKAAEKLVVASLKLQSMRTYFNVALLGVIGVIVVGSIAAIVASNSKKNKEEPKK